jgi:hypothetical protein
VLPIEAAAVARVQGALGLPTPIAPEGIQLMAQNWSCSSAKARRELGYRAGSLEKTLRSTIDWYLELADRGVFAGRGSSALSVASVGMRLARRAGFVEALRGVESYTGRRFVAGG